MELSVKLDPSLVLKEIDEKTKTLSIKLFYLRRKQMEEAFNAGVNHVKLPESNDTFNQWFDEFMIKNVKWTFVEWSEKKECLAVVDGDDGTYMGTAVWGGQTTDSDGLVNLIEYEAAKMN